jgi:hypothetical protein
VGVDRRLLSRAAFLAAILIASLAVGAVDGGSAAAVKSRSSSLPRCKYSDYYFELAALRHSTSPSSSEPVGLTVGLVASAKLTHSCALRRTARVAVETSRGLVLPTSRVSGNDATWRISATIRPWGQKVHTWVWHNWCGASSSFRVKATLSDGENFASRLSTPPRCDSVGTASALSDHGSGTRHIVGFTPGRIPAHILPKGTPPPLPEELIQPTNAWLVSDGYTLVAVYAGHPGPSAKTGMFAVVRQNLVFGIQYIPPAAARSVVYLGNVGSAHITTAPVGRRVETSAQHGLIHFTTTSGVHGILNLSRNTVTFTK